MTSKKQEEEEKVEQHHVDSEQDTENMEDNAPTEAEKLEAELQTANDKYLRLYAEFDNYKRRTTKEKIEMMQSAGKEVIGNLLTVMDDFDRALKMMENASNVEAVREGVDLIAQKFKKILQQQGLKEMDVIGQVFDADFQEAITNIPAPNAEMKGKVIDEVEKGYFLNDNVLRYAKVVVGN